MKKIYKMLISILIISMLTVTAISAVTGPYTGCISTSATKYDVKGIFYYFQPGSTPTSTCKTGDYQITIYEKTYIDSIVNSLQNQINSLKDRVTNLENNQSQTYEFGNFIEGGIDKPIKSGGYGEVINVSFNLPVDSYVYVSSSGGLSFVGDTNGTVNLWISMDGLHKADWDYNSFYIYGGGGWTGYSISAFYRLKKGNHIAYLYANSNKDLWGNTNIVAIATEKGSINGSSWYYREFY